MKEIWYFFKHRVFPSIAARAGKLLLSLLAGTCRYEVHGLEHFKASAACNPCLLLLWHNRIVMTPAILGRYAGEFTYAALVSRSRDGQLIATIVDSYKQSRSIRVSHNNRLQALHTVTEHLKTRGEILIVTPDGPRGPRYKVKAGTIHAAKAAGADIIGFSWSADKYWELKTWDRMRFPKPFAKITATFTKPIVLEKGEGLPTADEMERIESALLA